MIEFSHLNPHQRLLLLLLFGGRGFYLLHPRRYLAIEYVKVNTVRLFCKPPRLLHIIEQTNVGLPRHVFDCLLVGRIVHKLVESLLDIVMLIFLAFRCVICDVACNIWRRFKVDRSVQFYQPHSAIEVEPKQLPYHNVVHLWVERPNQFPVVRAGGAEVLGTQVVLLLAGDLRLDGHHLRGERIVVVALV